MCVGPKIWVVALVGILWVGCTFQHECDQEVDTDFSLEYTRHGGWIGRSTLLVNKDGAAEAQFLGYRALDSLSLYYVTDTLSDIEKSEWADRLNEIGFFCLEDNYTDLTPIPDYNKYEITVVSGGVSKTVTVISDGNYPANLVPDLLILFEDLYNELYIPILDSATVGTLILAREFVVCRWPFTAELPLSGMGPYAIRYSSSGQIGAYLDSLYHPGAGPDQDWTYLQLEEDTLYRLSVGTVYFSIRSIHWVEAWPQGLGILPADFPNESLVVRNDLFQELKGVVEDPAYSDYPVFIIPPLTDGIAAYELWLIKGEPLQ